MLFYGFNYFFIINFCLFRICIVKLSSYFKMSHAQSNKRDAECFSPAHLLSVSANEPCEKKK